MQLQILIDRMIDQARETDPKGEYCILLGVRPVTEKDWVRGKKVYRWCSVAHSTYIPNNVVVLAPAPDNVRNSDVFEYHGRILDGELTRHTVRRQNPVGQAAPGRPVGTALGRNSPSS